MSDTIVEDSTSQILRFLKQEEGIFRVPTVPTRDGKPIGNSGETIGHGRDLSKKPFSDFERKHLGLNKGRTFENDPLTDEEAEFLLVRDATDAIDAARGVLGADVFDNLNTARKATMVSTAFQLGREGLRGFPKMIKNVQAGVHTDAGSQRFFDEAALELLSGRSRMEPSKVFMQTPHRTSRAANMIRTGEF